MFQTAMVWVTWLCSVVYLYTGSGFYGFGVRGDYRPLALAGLVLCTACMVDRAKLVRLLQRTKRAVRWGEMAECD